MPYGVKGRAENGCCSARVAYFQTGVVLWMCERLTVLSKRGGWSGHRSLLQSTVLSIVSGRRQRKGHAMPAKDGITSTKSMPFTVAARWAQEHSGVKLRSGVHAGDISRRRYDLAKEQIDWSVSNNGVQCTAVVTSILLRSKVQNPPTARQ